MYTPYQSKYWAAQITLESPSGSLHQLSRSLSNARVDLNPHQVDAALFAMRSPLSKGVLLADEVGLGKTIEAGLVLAQRWAERRRRILIIVPATLRSQWAVEIEEKFLIPTLVLEATSFERLRKAGSANPFDQPERVVICSYHFAVNKAELLEQHAWDLVILDEAHRLRNVYKPDNKMARSLQDSLRAESRVLLTATPLQNSLLELFGLVSFIDPHVFGDPISFRAQFVSRDDEQTRNGELKRRLLPVCHRTLRRQVAEYIRFTRRIPITWDFDPTDDEHRLYELVSAYLQREELFALPASQRALLTMVLRKLLASSSFAIAGTLRTLLNRLEALLRESQAPDDSDLAGDFETLDETRDEWGLGDPGPSTPLPKADRSALEAEIALLRQYLALAERIRENAKGTALVEALGAALVRAEGLGAARKAVVFTESQRTQRYLLGLLEDAGYAGQVVTLNGTNTDPRSKGILARWSARHPGGRGDRPGPAVDVKAAIVEEFRERATILVATEAAAEGVNLQFCSLVVNYDLPWNPQRIEQRIGRCHRYGQKHDVVVVNFLNQRNAADRRVYQLLAEKLQLFDGVFGSSDQVLGALEAGVDVERRIAEIYQGCRTEEEIAAGFERLQADLDEQIQDRLARTRQLVLDHFDEDVHQRLRVHRDQALAALGERERRLLALARAELGGSADFETGAARFVYRPQGDSLGEPGLYDLDWREAERRGAHFFRSDHPLARAMSERALGRDLAASEVVFDYAGHGAPVAILAEQLGARGWLRVTRVRVRSAQTEEHLLAAALVEPAGTENGAPSVELDAEWCDRLLNLPARVGQALVVPARIETQLEDHLSRRQQAVLREVEERNGAFFDEEVEKLDRWAEDVKLGLERELKELDVEIRAARKEARGRVALAEKVEAQRRVKNLEQRRNAKRRELFEAQDEVERKRSELIDGIERRLRAETECETLFTLRWALPR